MSDEAIMAPPQPSRSRLSSRGKRTATRGRAAMLMPISGLSDQAGRGLSARADRQVE